MNDHKHIDHGNEGAHPAHVHPVKTPYWTRAHRDWRIWVALFFMLTAITIYVLSDNLAFLPHL